MELASPYIIAALAGWVIAQSLKYVVASYRNGRLTSLRQLYLSGSMPSAHSATVVAMLVVIALTDGVESGLFGLAAMFAAVVMYDAIMVRRSSGEQGESLTELIKLSKSKVRLPRVAKGHTPYEVLVGALLGAVVGLSVYYISVL